MLENVDLDGFEFEEVCAIYRLYFWKEEVAEVSSGYFQKTLQIVIWNLLLKCKILSKYLSNCYQIVIFLVAS